MADFGPGIVEDVVAACTAGAGETSEAFSRTFDQPLTVEAGTSGTFDPAAPPEGFDGAALLVVFTIDDIGAVAVLPESSGLLPDWLAAPDATGQSKLATLAQELGMLLLPETVMASDFQAIRVDHAMEALSGGGLPEEVAIVSLTLSSESDAKGTLSLVWPLSDPKSILATEVPQEEEASAPQAAETSPAPQAATQSVAASSTPSGNTRGLGDLPDYARSLLQIKLPVTVTLAAKKQPVEEILNLNLGSIIQFDKSCEEMLELGVGEQKIGMGEAVKVGDKFGIRLTSLVLPDERFHALRASG